MVYLLVLQDIYTVWTLTGVYVFRKKMNTTCIVASYVRKTIRATYTFISVDRYLVISTYYLEISKSICGPNALS